MCVSLYNILGVFKFRNMLNQRAIEEFTERSVDILKVKAVVLTRR